MVLPLMHQINLGSLKLDYGTSIAVFFHGDSHLAGNLKDYN
jgi:hypothetical protein